MNWRKLLFWKKPNATGSFNYNTLDQKLIRGTQPRVLPRWSQLKYLPQFLSVSERRVFTSALAVAVLASIGWVTFFLNSHLERIPREGGEYSEAFVGQPKYLNPLFSPTNDVDADLVALLYSGLFHYTKNQTLAPLLAKSYTISDDRKTYDITLRDDVKWSDGESFTADDALFTFELIQNPETNSPLVASFQGVAVEKIDERHLRFTLKEPFAPFLHSLTAGILPEHRWGDMPPSNIKLAQLNLQPVGTGPWQISKLAKDEIGNVRSIILKRNENYFEPKPFLRTVTIKFFPGYKEAMEAVRSQQVSAVSFAPHSDDNKLAESKTVHAYNLKLPQYTALFINQEKNTNLKDADIRLALATAIDKPALIKEALGGSGAVVAAPILQNTLGYFPDIKKINFNADEANTLLDKKTARVEPEEFFKLRSAEVRETRQAELDAIKQASSTPEQIENEQQRIEQEISDAVRQEMNPDQSFYRKNKAGQVVVAHLTTVDTPEYIAAAGVIKKMWEKAGIKTETLAVPSRQLIREVLKDHNYQILLYGAIVGSDPDPYPFWHSSQVDYPGLNLARYANRNADKMLEEARTTVDDNARAELYKKFQTTLADDLPAIFLYTPLHSFIVNQDIKGINVSAITTPADRYGGMAEWYVKTKLRWK